MKQMMESNRKKVLQSLPFNEEIASVWYNGFVMIHVPQHYHQVSVVEHFLEANVSGPPSIIRIDDTCLDKDKIKYDYLLSILSTNYGFKLKAVEKQLPELAFRNAFLRFIKNSKHTITIIVTISNALIEEQIKLLKILHSVLTSLNEEMHRLKIIMMDDYSVLAYEMQNSISFSNLGYFRKIFMSCLSKEEISLMLLELEYQPATTKAMSQYLFEQTGGHQGLIIDILSIIKEPQKITLAQFKDKVRYGLKQSSATKSITHFLASDKMLTEEALKYTKLRPLNIENKREGNLIRHGILSFNNHSISLIGGHIETLTKGIYGDLNKSHSTGNNLVDDAGPSTLNNFIYSYSESDVVVIHLSDLHIGPTFPFKLPKEHDDRVVSDHRDLCNMIVNDLESMGLVGRISGLIISGDFTEKALPAEFDIAVSLIKDILAKAEIDAAKLLLIPGNHDVNWDPSTLSDKNAAGVSKQDYERFLKLLPPVVHSTYDNGLATIKLRSKDEQTTLNLIGMDSNEVESPESAGIGFINPLLISRTEEFLKKQSKSEVKSINWIVTHHHVFPATSVKRKDAANKKISLLANTSMLLSLATKNNIELILHGHEHQPFITVSNIWGATDNAKFKKIISAGAGSISCDKGNLGPFGQNHYYVIVRRKKDLLMMSRSLGVEEGDFISHSNISIPL